MFGRSAPWKVSVIAVPDFLRMFSSSKFAIRLEFYFTSCSYCQFMFLKRQTSAHNLHKIRGYEDVSVSSLDSKKQAGRSKLIQVFSKLI